MTLTARTASHEDAPALARRLDGTWRDVVIVERLLPENLS